MIHYKDKTFCPFYDSCRTGSECPDALTLDVRRGAKLHGLPISQFATTPKCFVPADFNHGLEWQHAAEQEGGV